MTMVVYQISEHSVADECTYPSEYRGEGSYCHPGSQSVWLRYLDELISNEDIPQARWKKLDDDTGYDGRGYGNQTLVETR